VFDAHMPTPNQIHRQRPDVHTTEADLVEPPTGPRTEEGVRANVLVGVQYLEAWLAGLGCVPLYNLMEDAATAEISRAQLWQWVRHGAPLDDGRTVTLQLVRDVTRDEMAKLRERLGAARFDGGHFPQAIALFDAMIAAPELPTFLTLAAYEHVTTFAS
jgi:malate synthase